MDMSEEELQRLMAAIMREGGGGGSGDVPPPPPVASRSAPQQASGGGNPLMGAAMSSPWGMLGAAVIANESAQSASGNRQEQTGDFAKELLSGEVLERDASKYLKDIPGAEFHAEMGNPEGVLKNLKKSLMPWEWF